MQKSSLKFGVVKSQKTLNGNVTQQNVILHNWIVLNYGERCSRYERGCIVCEAWDYYDALKLMDFNKENIFNFSDNELYKQKKFDILKRRQVDLFFDKVRDYPEAINYLRGMLR